MSGSRRIAAFSVALLAVFSAAALVGGTIYPSGSEAEEGSESAHAESDETAHGAHGSESQETESSSAPPGLQVYEDGYRLVAERTRFQASKAPSRFSFTIVDADGQPIRDFEVEHEKEMHFIVVRRDFGTFEHLHPTMASDGTWTVDVDLTAAGVYRAYADFNAGGQKRALGTDLHVGGSYRPELLPEEKLKTRTESGLEVLLSTTGSDGEEGLVEFEVRDDGEVVNAGLGTYLGAAGHLVALRADDLAYLHTHPDSDELAFMTEYPSAGSYRMYVQFRYEGEIHTAAFTREVSE